MEDKIEEIIQESKKNLFTKKQINTKKEEDKIKYLVIENWTVKKVNIKNKEFRGNSEDYPRRLIYSWDNYKIYDYDKFKALPLVKMLIEDFDPPKDKTIYIVAFFCFIILILSWIILQKNTKIIDWLNKSNIVISSLWWEMTKTTMAISEVKEEKKDKEREKTVIEKVMEKEGIPTWIEHEEKIKNNNIVKIQNENESLKQNNLALQLEVEKQMLRANQPKVNELDYYNNIKAEYEKNERERLKKEVELEYIKEKKEILINEEKQQIREEIEKELYEKYKKIILNNCKKIWLENE